jgi:hypothetical protein
MEGAVTESLLLPTQLSEAISFREMASSWEGDPLTSEGARSLESLVGTGLQMGRALQLAWSLATEDNTVWESDGYRRRVQTIDFLATVVVDILTRTQDLLASARAKYPGWVEPSGTADVAARLQTAKELAAQVRETLTWLNLPRPPVNEDMLRRSQESLNRGEGEDVGEIIARLQSGGPLVKE